MARVTAACSRATGRQTATLSADSLDNNIGLEFLFVSFSHFNTEDDLAEPLFWCPHSSSFSLRWHQVKGELPRLDGVLCFVLLFLGDHSSANNVSDC